MANNNNINEQVYNLREDDALSSQVAYVVCVLMRRGVMSAGFGAGKELLIVHYTGYSNYKPVWMVEFFEQHFLNEILLAGKEKVKGVFICSDKNLIVPDDLYDEREAKEWMKHIHFTEVSDDMSSCELKDDKAHYLMNVPVHITELVKINFKNAVTLPLPVYQFKGIRSEGIFVHCCVTPEQACVTLHSNGQLLWHKVFDYTCAEDIVYEISHVCRENNIAASEVAFLCNAATAAEYGTISELSAYYPGIKAGDGSAISYGWAAAASLANQLLSCVS